MLEEFERPAAEWLQKQGWKENPFTLRIMPAAFVGYHDQLKHLVNHVQEGHKFALVIGATGSGKTTLLQLFRNEFSKERDVIYAPKPPKPEELVELFLDQYPQSFLHRLLGKHVNIHTLAGHVNARAKRKVLLLVDEGHEADVSDMEWLRTVTDQCDSVQLVLAGLPTLEEILRRNLETFRSRVTTKVDLVALSETEVQELIVRRIESVGGSGSKPFTDEAVRGVYQRSGGFPREVLKLCDSLVQNAIEQKSHKIDGLGASARPSGTQNVRVDAQPVQSKDFLRDLPYKQKKVVALLAQEDNMYPSEIAERLGLEKYKSKQHAVRSLNNILQRLAEEGYVERSARGKGYVYALVPSVKNSLIQG
ncbi:MAG: AAA family ATPase [Candidatus Aenigmatarchaeota archaeon]|nr:MAG: AAA family ATPase [Candidatus Aenigmarchaeota archaeon]